MQRNQETDMKARLLLILGGARSGKSSFAEQLALTSGQMVAFIATATASDEDMRIRIAHHRSSRPANWTTIEEPLDLVGAVKQAAEVADVVLLDCMTLWLSNFFWRDGEVNFDENPAISTQFNDETLAEVERLLTTLTSLEGKIVIIVSNEIGLGIVPEYAVSRAYRDILGRVNQRLAHQAERVYLMIAGLAVDIKRLHEAARL